MFMLCSHTSANIAIGASVIGMLRNAPPIVFPGSFLGLHLRSQVFQFERQQSGPRLFKRILIFQTRAWSFGAQAKVRHPVSCLFNLVFKSVHQTYPFQFSAA